MALRLQEQRSPKENGHEGCERRERRSCYCNKQGRHIGANHWCRRQTSASRNIDSIGRKTERADRSGACYSPHSSKPAIAPASYLISSAIIANLRSGTGAAAEVSCSR